MLCFLARWRLMLYLNVIKLISPESGKIAKNVSDKSYKVLRGTNFGDLEFDLETHFQGQMTVNFHFLNGNMYFLLLIRILRKKIRIFCPKHFFFKCPFFKILAKFTI